MSLIIMVAMFGLLYAGFFLPQQRKMKAHREMLARLEVGDEVLTAAGIYGTITEFDGQTVFLAVSDSLEIKITRESVAERVVYADPASEITDSVTDDVESES